MILASLELQDFKQFHGTHRFTPPAAGAVGILGDNGAGKSTLFQAIEWCLYQPREFELAGVPTRGQAAKPRVTVVLHDPADNVRYVIERRLDYKGKRWHASAETYREDQAESIIVHGPEQVTDYVERRLLGLTHRAFVTTFFTRQKELSFFGDLKDTDRRREVGKLLGFDTIRAAQRQIGEDRTAARGEATQLAQFYARRLGDRDLAAERADAEHAVAERAAAVDAAEEHLRDAAIALQTAKNVVVQSRALKDQVTTLSRDLTRLDGEINTASSRCDAARLALAMLDERARERVTLAPIADTEPDLIVAATAMDHDRARDQRRQELQTTIDGLVDRRLRLSRETERHVSAAGASLDGWAWTNQDRADPLAGIDRLIRVAAACDATATQTRLIHLQSCLDLAERRDQAKTKLAQYVERLRLRERERDELLAAGDPNDELAALATTRDRKMIAAQDAASLVLRATEEIERLTPLVAGLRVNRLDEGCPTCHRPFSEQQAADALALFETRVSQQERVIETETNRNNGLMAEIQRIEVETGRARERKDILDDLISRIAAGQEHIQQQQAECVAAATALDRRLAEHGLTRPPSLADINAARAAAEIAARLDRARAELSRLRGQLAADDEREREARAEIAALGIVAYDAAAHQDLQRRLRAAQTAAAQIAAIDGELARRPGHAASLAEARDERARLDIDRGLVEAQLAEIGFDPAALAAAEAAEQAALERERESLQAQAEAVGAHRQELHALARLTDDHVAIDDLGRRARERRREADDLDRMYREFSGFEQFVARRLTPQLAEHASELLSQVTAGKYHRVELTDNFGIRVYDSDDEAYPIEAFSGGERDVIALCARFALSNLIGGQAHRPPAFVVLDEVFGSLDAARRAQLLETLGNLTGAGVAFSQLFVISHVDDIRLSPIFDDLWKVTETAEGMSQLQNTTALEIAEDV